MLVAIGVLGAHLPAGLLLANATGFFLRLRL